MTQSSIVSQLRKPRQREGYHCVYFIASEVAEKVKIGISRCLEDRILNLRCGSPCRLYVLGFIKVEGGRSAAREAEKQFHKYFEPFHSHGEWFELNAETRDLIVDCIFPSTPVPKLTPGEDLLRTIFQDDGLSTITF